MFTGIIEAQGLITDIAKSGSNINFEISSPISELLKIDQSVSHNGVCLTVTHLSGGKHRVTAIQETLKKSNLGTLAIGSTVNLERCMLNNGRFDGHIVQGHVDQIAMIKSIEEQSGSWLFHIGYDPSQGNVTVEKGSIAINGVSLTCFNSGEGNFTVAIIPYTYEHTNFGELKKGDSVNLEFDIIGKYVKRLMSFGR